MRNNELNTTPLTEAQRRKQQPVATGCIDYFPQALLAVANLSFHGNQQHNPGQPLHWAREKSTDHADCLMRHFIERGTLDTDGIRHSAKVAWRALALLQTEIEKEQAQAIDAAGQKAFEGVLVKNGLMQTPLRLVRSDVERVDLGVVREQGDGFSGPETPFNGTNPSRELR